MAKQQSNPKKLIPEIIKSERPDLKSEQFISHIPGHYLLEQPDGVLINVTPSMYERAYKNNPNFKLKKSPNQ